VTGERNDHGPSPHTAHPARAGGDRARRPLAPTDGGCGADDDSSLPDRDAPGRNARAGDLTIRYARPAEPTGEPWRPGGDATGITLRFEDAGSTAFGIQAQPPVYDGSAAPKR
jgi:hypothetical protein